MGTVLITGSAGFIGYHLAQYLLKNGYRVAGYDALTSYYDVKLKERRHQALLQNANFSCKIDRLENFDSLRDFCNEVKPNIIIHLAAQAGVRFSLEQPRSYIDSNIVGTFNVMECARELGVDHLLMASTSSVYGANEEMPFCENDKADTPLTIYAATKKASEAMGHSYAHLWKLPTTMFRFFTVYGPWGRPDMALFKFTKGILEGTPIDIYNNGEMYRDFTYVEDLVRGIALLIKAVPPQIDAREGAIEGDSLSHAAPYRVVNIGNSDKVRLMDFVEAIEDEIGIEAKRNYMPMQKGDVYATWANSGLLAKLTGYTPETDFREGVRKFVRWYREYYNV